MKEDSCRRCGNGLEVNKKCDICNKENQFYCHECGYVTEEQIHLECMMIRINHESIVN
jgi:predicted amidophosphoribosyltransferase